MFYLIAGFHQRCHDPKIPPDALEYFTPWVCCYCGKGSKNPHIEKNPFEEHQSSKEQFSESSNTTVSLPIPHSPH